MEGRGEKKNIAGKNMVLKKHEIDKDLQGLDNSTTMYVASSLFGNLISCAGFVLSLEEAKNSSCERHRLCGCSTCLGRRQNLGSKVVIVPWRCYYVGVFGLKGAMDVSKQRCSSSGWKVEPHQVTCDTMDTYYRM